MRNQTKPFLCSAILLASCLLIPAVRTARADEELDSVAKHRPVVDAAVERALEFLAKDQENNPKHDGSFTGPNGNTNAIAGLVGMAFLSKGYLPGTPPYGDTINGCIDFILSTKDQNGYLGVRGDRMYGHAIATLFLSEVSGMVDPTRQEKIDKILPKALKVILKAQAVKKEEFNQGGWRYETNSADSDMSVTGWCLMALRSARLNGAPVPDSAIQSAIKYVLVCQRQDGGFVYTQRVQHLVYVRLHTWRPGPVEVVKDTAPSTTGVALLSLELSGMHDSPQCRAAGDNILRHALDKRGFCPGVAQPEYTAYYGANGMFQLGGTYWEKFSGVMFAHLIKTQGSDGSWTGTSYGTMYRTAMYVLSMTVPCRQLPIYQR